MRSRIGDVVFQVGVGYEGGQGCDGGRLVVVGATADAEPARRAFGEADQASGAASQPRFAAAFRAPKRRFRSSRSRAVESIKETHCSLLLSVMRLCPSKPPMSTKGLSGATLWSKVAIRLPIAVFRYLMVYDKVVKSHGLRVRAFRRWDRPRRQRR